MEGDSGMQEGQCGGAVPSSQGEVVAAEKMERGGCIWDTC